MKKLEIERKFLLKNLPVFGAGVLSRDSIIQVYSKTEKGWVRYRACSNDKGTSFIRTFKKKIDDGIYEEVEKVVTLATFLKVLDDGTEKKVIDKIRYNYLYNNQKFEIDVFNDMRLVVMEIELKSMEQKIDFPKVISNEILSEVTKVPGMTNLAMATKVSKKHLENLKFAFHK